LPTAKTHLANANRAIEDGNIDKAVSFFNKVIEIKPNCHEAYWGLYICNSSIDRYYGYKDKYGNSGTLTKANIMLDTLNKYAYRAIKYAPPEQAQKYKAQIAEEERFIDRVRKGDYDKRTSGTAGCYIATAVYGSYCCDEVLQLRRFRDDVLSKNIFGRAFIKVYYAISPSMARHIKPNSKVNRAIKRFLEWFRSKI
jgi:tetratricopeptide (TPR) repeat protein